MSEGKRKFSKKYIFKSNWLIILLSFSLVFFLFSLKLESKIDNADFSYQSVSVIQSINPVTNQTLSEKITKDLDEKIAQKKIKAQSIVILDTSSDEIVFGYNQDDLMPLASLVKLVSVWLAIQELSFGDFIIIDKISLAQSGDSGLELFSRYNLFDLSGFSLATSSNDAVFAMMMAVDKKVSGSRKNIQNVDDKDFNFSPELFSKLTSLAYKNGLTDFYTNSTTGLDVSDAPTAFASASQMSRFVSNFIIENPEISSWSIKEKVSLSDDKQKTITQKNTNPAVEDFPFLIFSKTGYTQKSGGNLVWAINKDGNIYVIVLMGSGFDGRFSDFKEINLVLQSYL